MNKQIQDYMKIVANRNKEKEMKREKVTMLIAMDSRSCSNTADRDAVLEDYGFCRESPKKGLPLPESTYVGKVDSEDAGKELVREIWKELKDKKLEPTRICGGIINDSLFICDKGEII